MAAPVWVLSVDLQTKTATFQSGMADAARSARGAFQEISSGARQMGEGVSTGATNTRAAIGLIDNTIRGDHMRAMADLIHEYQNSAIVMAALPFAATAGAIALAASVVVAAVVHFRELREEQEKMAANQTKFGTSINDTFNSLDEKLLTAEQRSDELRNDHLGALGKELELINRQSMNELVHSLEMVSKAADLVFADLKSHWYTFGIGSAGAQHALEQFQTQYASLLSQGKDKEASDLLRGTRDSANQILNAQNFMASRRGKPHDPTQGEDASGALNMLKAAGVGYTEKEVKAQADLVQALNAQLEIEGKVNELKKVDSGNATRSTAGEMSKTASEAARQAADSQLRMGQMAIAADKATAQARLAVSHASVEERIQSEMDFAKREYDLQEQSNKQQIAALDKLGKDYPNQLKALQDKSLEITRQYQTTVAQISGQGQAEAAARDLRTMEESEREKIDATEQGSKARLAAIDSAIAEEASHNLQAEDNYRSLLTQRVQTVREMAQQEAEQKAEAGRQAAEDSQKMGQLAVAAEQEQQALKDSLRRVTDQQRMTEELQSANELYAIQMSAYAQQIAALDKNGKDYENKLKAIQDKQKELTQEHENEITSIRNKAEMARNARIMAGEQQLEDSIARGLASTLMGHQSFATMMTSIGNQVAEGMIQNALKSMMADDMTKERDAASAARAAFRTSMNGLPFPANIVMAPAMGAAAFAAAMAFNEGTDMVPGVGRGDIVPAMLTPGEGVVPGGVMDGLRKMASSGDMGGDKTTHVHVHYQPTIHAIDGPSVQKMLNKHGATFTKHLHSEMRKMNR